MRRNWRPARSGRSAQLLKLSSMLKGLEQGGSGLTRRGRLVKAAVRTGTYSVEAIRLSRRIIGECLDRRRRGGWAGFTSVCLLPSRDPGRSRR
jgi:hypothetical protein